MNTVRKKYEQTNQNISEKVGRVDKQYELGSEIHKLENKTDTFKKLITGIQDETEKFLQPDPKLRKKYVSSPRIERSASGNKPVKTLVETMTIYGRKLDELQNNKTNVVGGDSQHLGKSLVEFGNSLEELSDQKISFENTVRHEFLDPLDQILSKDFAEVAFHRRKLENRRLKYSYKARHSSQDDLDNENAEQIVKDKFVESLRNAQLAMSHVTDGSELEHTTNLYHLAKSMMEYHSNCEKILADLTKSLREKSKGPE